MPKHDAQTWLRNPTDIDWDEEGAWLIAAPYVPTPELLMAARELIRVTNGERDWFKRPAIQTSSIDTKAKEQTEPATT